eukprot:Gb_12700 [translate_table: standard]
MDRSTQVCMYLFTSILFAFITSCSCSPTNSSYQQCQTLLAFKEGVHDPYNTLSSWINGFDCCGWKGVGCDVITREVVTLNITFGGLNGTLNEEGRISFSLFQNFIKLTVLSLFANRLTVYIPPNWIPPFQLESLDLSSCNIGGVIPPFISTQYNLQFLYLINNSLIGSIPTWLWDLPLISLVLSQNNLSGQLALPNSPSNIKFMLFNTNHLTGSIPLEIGTFFPNLKELLFASNNFSGIIPSSIGNMIHLDALDLSYNKLHGKIPSSLGNCLQMQALRLTKNNLEGEIPMEIGNLPRLETLHLNGNRLTGTLSSNGLQNSSALQILDVGNNKISGHIPRWLGNLLHLSILVLRANYLEGEIPLEVTSIKTLQILDVSHNNLSGPIPHNLAMLTAMTNISQQTGFRLQNLSSIDEYYYSREEVQITNKGQIMSYTYGSILSLVICIDLSKTHLTGSIPSAIQELNGLITLNLSRNHLSGDIPDVFGVDMQLNSLDLSHNQLSGKVPGSLGLPGSLGVLNFSYNRLCGRIPVVRHLETFGEDSYVGNPCLCGPPLNTSCWHGVAPPTTEDDDEDKDETENELLWYGGLLLSHAVGFWVMFAVLFFKRARRRKCLRVMDRVVVRLLGRIGYW